MPTVGSAFDFLTDQGSTIFREPIGSMLYVGHRGDTHPWWHVDYCPKLGVSRIAVIDIDKGNLMTAAHVTDELYHGDIRRSDAPRGFDLVFWDEGPEHLAKDESLAMCQLLAKNNRHVLISCPWGYQPQGSGPTDPEFHHWGPQPADFEAIGWTARVFGVEFVDGRGHGNLIAWI